MTSYLKWGRSGSYESEIPVGQSLRQQPPMPGVQQDEIKADQGYTVQVIARIIRLGNARVTRFAAVGALGTLVNLLVLALLVHGMFDINYVVAAVIAAEISILHNFLLQERFVFRDMRDGVNTWRNRLTKHLLFNNAEALVRLPFLILLVETMHALALLAQAATLAIAFVVRFLFASQVVYRARPAPRHRAASNRVTEYSA